MARGVAEAWDQSAAIGPVAIGPAFFGGHLFPIGGQARTLLAAHHFLVEDAQCVFPRVHGAALAL